MELIQIIGVGFTGVLIATILKEYKPEFKVYVSLIVGAIIFFIVADKLSEFIVACFRTSHKRYLVLDERMLHDLDVSIILVLHTFLLYHIENFR